MSVFPFRKKRDSDQFLVLIILYDLASILSEINPDVEAVLKTINNFCSHLEVIVSAANPVKSKIDISHSEVFWSIEDIKSLRLQDLLRDINQRHTYLNEWLTAEGFPKIRIGFGVATGLVIIGGQDAIGTTITRAFACANEAIQRSAVVISENAVLLLHDSWIKGLSFVPLVTPGIPEKVQKVIIQDLSVLSK